MNKCPKNILNNIARLESSEGFVMKSPEGNLEKNPAKLDDELLQRFMQGFYGYGNFESNLWFVGMEEGGGNSVAEIQKRLEIWNKHGQVELEDVVDFHNEIGVGEYFSQTPRLQRTWSQLIRIILESEGGNSNTDQCKKYQISEFARRDSDHCLLELFPLPSPSSTHWLYAQFSKLKFLKDRETYKKHCLDFRIEHLKERIRFYQPAAVIFYGSGYKDFWAQVAECNFKQHSGDRFYYAEDSNTRFYVIQHPAAQGVSNHYFSNIGRLLFDKFCN